MENRAVGAVKWLNNDTIVKSPETVKFRGEARTLVLAAALISLRFLHAVEMTVWI